MTRLGIALAVMGSLFVGACSGSPDPNAPDFAVADPNLTGTGGSASASDSQASNLDHSNEGETSPVTVLETAPDTEPVTEPSMDQADGGDAGAATDASIPTAPPMIVTKTGSCTSRYSGHSSVAKMVWVVAQKKVTIKSLTVRVANTTGRSKNDVDLWVRLPGAAEFKSFNSGDILANGKTVSVYLPGNFPNKVVDTKIRIETNFDQSGSDPSASCTIKLQ